MEQNKTKSGAATPPLKTFDIYIGDSGWVRKEDILLACDHIGSVCGTDFLHIDFTSLLPQEAAAQPFLRYLHYDNDFIGVDYGSYMTYLYIIQKGD